VPLCSFPASEGREQRAHTAIRDARFNPPFTISFNRTPKFKRCLLRRCPTARRLVLCECDKCEILRGGNCVAFFSAGLCPLRRSALRVAAPRCPDSAKIPTAIPTLRVRLPISRRPLPCSPRPSLCSRRAPQLLSASHCRRRHRNMRPNHTRPSMPPCSTSSLNIRRRLLRRRRRNTRHHNTFRRRICRQCRERRPT